MFLTIILMLLSESAKADPTYIQCRPQDPIEEFLYIGPVPKPIPPAWGTCYGRDVGAKAQQFVQLVRDREYPSKDQLLTALAQFGLTGDKTQLQTWKAQRDAVDAKYPWPIPSQTPGILGH